MRSCARENARDGWWTEAAIRFRQPVAREFERLVRDGVPMPNHLQRESDSFVDALSLRCQDPIGECTVLG